ncbi:DUF6118 family protein [Sphingopyxis indica]|uniref:DUF6118 family protein n=1 Tax=Sphingopyxis indica TaxID=436663 RepID=UPI0029394A9E|nr:DUF6118 family protein [Sphingopyxis indica]
MPSNAPEPDPREETAAEAFARLDGRVAGLDGRIALMARAVEHMAAERFEVEIPDYNPTLEKTNAWLANILQRLETIEAAPALDVTPETMGARIAAAAHKAREDDEASIRRVREDQRDSVQALRQIIGHARTQQSQREHLLWGIGGGILAGCLLWAILPGMIASSVPENWHWPERAARRTMGEATLWGAGMRLMHAGNPEGWQAIVDAADMRQANHDAIAACERAAAKAKKPVRCMMRIKAPLSNRQ